MTLEQEWEALAVMLLDKEVEMTDIDAVVEAAGPPQGLVTLTHVMSGSTHSARSPA